MRYSPATGETAVHTDIRLLEKIGFFIAFSFTRNSSETWRTGRLVSLRSETIEHGEKLQVDGKATPQGFRVVSRGGPFIAAASTLTSNSLWTPRVLEQDTVAGANPRLRMLIALHPEALTVVARADSRIVSFEDLKGARIGLGKSGSGYMFTRDIVLAFYGITIPDKTRMPELEPAEQNVALYADAVDAIVFAAGHPNGLTQEATTGCPAPSDISARPMYSDRPSPLFDDALCVVLTRPADPCVLRDR